MKEGPSETAGLFSCAAQRGNSGALGGEKQCTPMTIRASYLSRLLNAATPGSGFARELATAPDRRLDHGELRAAVDRYRSGFERGEQRVLDAVLPHLDSPDLFGGGGLQPGFELGLQPQPSSSRFRLTGKEVAWKREWDTYSGERPFGTPILSPDGRCLYQIHEDHTLRAHSREGGEELWRLKLESPNFMGATSISPDGKRLVVVARSPFDDSPPGTLWVIDLEHQKIAWSLEAESGQQWGSVQLTRDGKLQLAQSKSAQLRTFELQSGAEAESIALPAIPTGDAPLMGGADRSVVMIGHSPAEHWRSSQTHSATDTLTGETLWTRDEGTSYAYARCLSPDGETLYVGGNSLTAVGVRTGQVEWEVPMRESLWKPLQASPDGLHLVTPGRELRIFDAGSGELVRTVKPEDPSAEFPWARFTADGQAVLARDSKGRFMRVAIDDGEVTLLGPKDTTALSTFSCDHTLDPLEKWAYTCDTGKLWAVELTPREP
jgi:WD40 repeat protein